MLIFILETTELDLLLQILSVQNVPYPKALFFLQKSRLQLLCLHSSTPCPVLTWREQARGGTENVMLMKDHQAFDPKGITTSPRKMFHGVCSPTTNLTSTFP